MMLIWFVFALIGCVGVYSQFLFDKNDYIIHLIRYWMIIYCSFLGTILGRMMSDYFSKDRNRSDGKLND